MATTQANADIAAPAQAVFAVIADPTRLPAWDMTYDAVTPLHGDPAGEPAFEARRTLADRSMRLACRVVRAESPTTFAFACDGDAGERVREAFSLAPARDGAATRFTREQEFELPGADPLAAVPALTYSQAWLDRSVEQAFGHLNVLLAGADQDAGSAPEATTRSPTQAGTPPRVTDEITEAPTASPDSRQADGPARDRQEDPGTPVRSEIAPEAVGDERRPEGVKRFGVLDFVKLELGIFLAAVVLGLVFLAVIAVLATK